MPPKQDALARTPSSRKSSRPLYILLALYIAISLGFYIAGEAAAIQQWFYPTHYARVPLDVNEQTGAIDYLQPEAVRVGLKIGDRLQALNGAPFSGEYQLRIDVRYVHPGDALAATVQRSNGAIETVRIQLAPLDRHIWNASQIAFFAALIFLPLLGLVAGYWVVAVRPTDFNAWLVLIVLTNPESFFGNLDWRWWPNPWFSILASWVVIVSMLQDPALILLGIYFPERWRLDIRWPWAKWLILAPQFAGFFAALVYFYVYFFAAGATGTIAPVAFYYEHVPHILSMTTNVVFWIALFDKMRTATTPDARRRLRVLAIGSAISLGPVTFMFVVLPLFGFDTRHDWLYELIVPFYVIFIFTIVYVLVVDRAMNLRILVRMGTKYALARGMVWILRVAVIALLILLFNTPTQQLLPTLARIAGIVLLILLLRLRVFKRLSAWVDRKFFREAYNTELVLAELSDQVRRFTEKEPLLETVTGRIAEVLHVPQIAVWLRGSDAFHLQQALGVSALEPLLLSDSSTTIQTLSTADRPLTLYRENPGEWFVEAPPEEQRALNRMNTEILLALPGRDRLMGVMALGPKQSEEPYTPSDLGLLRSVATQTGLALEVGDLAQSLAREAAQRERIHREIEIAREVQERLFPQTIPAIAGIDLAGHCRPAQGVGGDYYDFIELEGNCLGLAIGDVSGKGISAALLMASLRASLRGMTLYGLNDLAELMQKVNRLVYEASAANRYATFFFAVYDIPSRELRYVNAGHNPPVLLRGAELLRLETGGPVVGLLRSVPYSQGSLTLLPGDVLLSYTDGISEAMTAAEEEWGEERMIAALQTVSRSSASEIVNAVFSAADAFTQGADQHDDMTILVMKLLIREGAGPPEGSR